eukprot:767425-Hanusia_phi.AAC.3
MVHRRVSMVEDRGSRISSQRHVRGDLGSQYSKGICKILYLRLNGVSWQCYRWKMGTIQDTYLRYEAAGDEDVEKSLARVRSELAAMRQGFAMLRQEVGTQGLRGVTDSEPGNHVSMDFLTQGQAKLMGIAESTAKKREHWQFRKPGWKRTMMNVVAAWNSV